MLFFVDNKGTIIAGKPSPVYQGSADTNNIVLVAPFAANLEFGVAFTLPNGVTTEMYMMSRGGAVNGVEYAPSGEGMAIWTFSMPSEITAYYGTVYAQFYAYGVNGQITPTSRTSFVVAKGVPQILPETPSQDIYNRILTVLSQLNSQLEGGTYAARAIYWWIDTFTYGMNEITFYPIGTYGAFVRSIVTENTNNQPYGDDDVLDSAHWQELVNFNRIYEAEQNAIESAQNAAESEKNAAASEAAAAASQAAAAQSESNAAASERNAALAEEHAAESEVNAAVSEKNAQDSAVSAAASATEAAESAKTVTDYLGKTTVFVEQLPDVGDPSLLYFVAGDSNNLFSIYTWENGAWKLLGAANLVVNNTGIVFGALTADGWVENSQKINIEKVTGATNVSASAAKGFAAAYLQYGIELSETVEGGVIFTCKTVPAENIAVILEITQQQEIPDSDGYYTESEVDALIATERSARESADSELQDSITAEVSAREQSDTQLQSAISAETSAREQEDENLQTAIDTEEGERKAAVTSLQQGLSAETTARKNADTALQNSIDSETSARQSADTQLQQKITEEVNARQTADNEIKGDVSALQSAKQNITDNSLETTAKTIVGAINENNAAIDALRNDMTAQEHFKGFADTAADVQEITGDLNDFVYCIATGTIWTYGSNGWTDSGKAYPSDATPLATTAPVMDGTATGGTSNEAARADHRHPSDTSRASAAALQEEIEERTSVVREVQNSLNSEITRAKAAEQANATAAKNAQSAADSKYTKPSTGIPASDLAQSVQNSLSKADSALQSAPVTSVNGKTGDVKLSASDVGAATAAQGAKADSALQSIPVATSSSVGGVKPVAKTSTMTQPVGVDNNGALFTEPGGAAGGGGEVIDLGEVTNLPDGENPLTITDTSVIAKIKVGNSIKCTCQGTVLSGVIAGEYGMPPLLQMFEGIISSLDMGGGYAFRPTYFTIVIQGTTANFVVNDGFFVDGTFADNIGKAIVIKGATRGELRTVPPEPTAQDAGKVPTVNADGTGYELKEVSSGDTSTIVKTAAEWESQNPVLAVGEFGYDTTNKITKMGDGATPWKELGSFVVQIPPTFADSDWTTIAELSENGQAQTYFKVGDEKTIELTTGEEVTLVILGFNHDDLADGSGKAGMTIGMKNMLKTYYEMNSTRTNAGGWKQSEMRASVMPTLLSQLPSDLQSVIKQVNKKTATDNTIDNVETTAEKLWLLAIAEIYAPISIENSNSAALKSNAEIYKSEGTQYKYYKNLIGDNNGGTNTNPLLAKKLSNGNGGIYSWWLRSINCDSTEHFRSIGASGSFSQLFADSGNGMSYCFCV